MTYVLILFSVCLSAFSQVILRYGMTRPEVAEALAGGSLLSSNVVAIVRSPYVIGGLACYGFGAIVWLLVLSRIPVSHAYPFVSLGIVLTALAGVVALGETISLTACLGILLIISGILCIAVGR
jgi:multidrug transporter EmrE-like cation transporter